MLFRKKICSTEQKAFLLHYPSQSALLFWLGIEKDSVQSYVTKEKYQAGQIFKKN